MLGYKSREARGSEPSPKGGGGQGGGTTGAGGCYSPMLDHTGIVVTDLAKAKRFYDAIAKPLGLKTNELGKDSFILGRSPTEYPYLWIGTLIPSYWIQGSKPGINQMHVAFAAPSQVAVDDFHKAALSAGGRDNGKPGQREGVDNYYGAFVLDPDGNNIEACWRGPPIR